MPGARILVVKLGALGDFIQALGAMKAIRHAHRDDHITLLTTAPFAELARKSQYFDDVMVDSRPKAHQLGRWLSLRRRLNAAGFSRVYDLQNNDRTALYMKLMTPRPEWVGAAKGASHRNASPERTARQAFYGHVQTLGLAGVDGVEIDDLSWMSAARHFDGLAARYALIVPGASPKHPQKRWPAQSYAELCRVLSSRGIQPVLIGGETEKSLTSGLLRSAPGCLDLAGRTGLEDLAALARNACGAVGNDTGPMHVIAPTGCPSIVLFSGKSNPVRHAPIGRSVTALQKPRIEDISLEEVTDAFDAQSCRQVP